MSMGSFLDHRWITLESPWESERAPCQDVETRPADQVEDKPVDEAMEVFDIDGDFKALEADLSPPPPPAPPFFPFFFPQSARDDTHGTCTQKYKSEGITQVANFSKLLARVCTMPPTQEQQGDALASP